MCKWSSKCFWLAEIHRVDLFLDQITGGKWSMVVKLIIFNNLNLLKNDYWGEPRSNGMNGLAEWTEQTKHLNLYDTSWVLINIVEIISRSSNFIFIVVKKNNYMTDTSGFDAIVSYPRLLRADSTRQHAILSFLHSWLSRLLMSSWILTISY